MSAATDELLRQAIAAHRGGAVAEASRLYRRVLELDPTSAAACGNLGIIAAQRGDLQAAEQLFRQSIRLRPHDPEGFNNLGSLLQQQGRFEEAIAAHQRAIALKPDYAEAYFALGNALHGAGRLDEALAALQQAIALRSNYAAAWNNVGVIRQRRGQSGEALAAYRQAATLRPDDAEAKFNLANMLHEIGELGGAADAYRQVIALRPDMAQAFNNLGTVLRDQGRREDALASFAAALERNPAFAEAHHNRGIVLRELGRLDAALAAYSEAIRSRPTYAEALTNAGGVLCELGRVDEAIAAHRQVLALRPDHADAHNNLAAALLTRGRPEEALAAGRAALTLAPDHPGAFYNVGNAWRELGKLEGAIAAYQTALRLRPDDADAFSQLTYHRWRACDWTDHAAAEERLVDMVRRGTARVPPFYLLATSAGPADQLVCARRWIEPFLPPPQAVFRHRPGARRNEIRLGYLSGDFHQHATASLMAELFECHDRARFEVFAYSYGPDEQSPMRRRLVQAFDRFVDLAGLPHQAAAQRIHDDGIDILVDLKGHTHGARPQIAAYRPAPVQVSYLGYPATMGAAFIDYIVVDPVVVPPEQQRFFDEKLVHLPGCYQPNDSKRAIAASAPSRRDCGLPANGFVFCCFNGGFKITPTFFAIWMRLLAAVPGSVLWLLASNDLVERNLRREAERCGIDPQRLIFAPVVASPEHLARQCHADLFLDTLPCNAHTTASDALWAGLPVLTCLGDTFAGRVAASLLTKIGLPDLITGSLADYERAALQFARVPRRLAALREALDQNRKTAGLFSGAPMASHLQAAFTIMWETWQAGAAPKAFSLARG
jgi:predicted O-linked N-acetylglucosamine transferase (SPINDLY family)